MTILAFFVGFAAGFFALPVLLIGICAVRLRDWGMD